MVNYAGRKMVSLEKYIYHRAILIRRGDNDGAKRRR